MGVTSVELWQRIAASQLASPLLCRTWAADAAAALSASEALDAQRVGDQLVSQGKLTRFQIETLLSDSKQPLIRNGYRLLEPVNYTAFAAPHVRSIWKDWWAVAKTPTSPVLWMRWIEANEFKQPALAKSNPALPRALQQSQLRHERLQVVEPPEMANGTLQLSVEPVQGRLLSGLCNGQPLPTENVWSLLQQVAAALTPLHAAGLSHGRVTPDRICVVDSGEHLLLRDPLCGATMHMTSSDAPTATGLLGAQLPAQLDVVSFMAPEFLLPAQVATPQSDLYSLGCVAWLLLTGRAPFSGKQPEQVLAAHAEKPLDLKQLPTIPEPLLKCLYHCLAKNPDARFAQAGQLAQALQEAQRIVARGPSTQNTAKAVEAKTPESQPIAAATLPAKTMPTAPQPSAAQITAAPSTKPKPKPDAAPSATPTTPSATEVVAATAVVPAAKTTPLTTPTPTSTASSSTPNTSIPTTSTTKVAPAVNKPAVANQQTVSNSNAPTTTATAAATATPVSPATPTATPSLVQPSPAQTSATAETTAAAPATQPAKPQKRLAQPGKPPGRRPAVRKSKKSQGANWLTAVIGGGALLVLLLIVVVMNGGSGSSSTDSVTNKPASNPTGGSQPTQTPTTPATPIAPVNPLADKFELVSDAPTALWAPPRLNEPLALDLLPPGGQFFAALRPNRLVTQADTKQLMSLLDADINPLWKSITEVCELPLEQIDQVIIAAYPTENGPPQTAMRIKLADGQTLAQLKSKWKSLVYTKVKDHALLVSQDKAFYIQQQPFVESQNVTEFSVGPTELMREVAELQGAAAAMSGQMEQLAQATDKMADVNLLINPVFFYAEGRLWLDKSPPRFRTLLEKWVTRDMRALMLSTSLSDPWYYELRMIGSSDRDAVGKSQKLSDAKRELPQDVESWLVNELPHPHWRAMANRFPNMLRALDAQTRIGVENGQAIVNGYLPMAAAPNLIYASWMALQTGSTVSTGNVAASGNSTGNAAETALTPEQILNRKISLSIDQTGIENVLQAIGEQANEKLPAGTKPLRFELDGAGFQRSGITRNQQIKPNFEVKDCTVREALILLSKKGNPVQPHDDLTTDDQKLIWVLIDGDNPDKALVSLTSREAAVAAGYKLPAEFVK